MSESVAGLKFAKVAIDKVQPHPENPRRGNVEQIAESLRRHGQYRPLTVQTSTSFVLVGNHTWKAAKELGWDKVQVVYIDVDDAMARRIMLADNRLADLGTYDQQPLFDLLASLEADLVGTGYDENDLRMLGLSLDIPDTELSGEPGRLDELAQVECPACGERFVPKKP